MTVTLAIKTKLLVMIAMMEVMTEVMYIILSIFKIIFF